MNENKSIGNSVNNLDINEKWNIYDKIKNVKVAKQNNSEISMISETNIISEINVNSETIGTLINNTNEYKYLRSLGMKHNKNKNKMVERYYCILCKNEVWKNEHYGHIVGNPKDKNRKHT